MTIPQEAIEAASRILSATWTGEKEYSDTFDEARDILTAALPALEQQIREKVAQEVQSMPHVAYTMPNGRIAKVVRRDDAAQIARGEQA